MAENSEKLERAGALWAEKSKAGNTYFTGTIKINVVGFVNKDKKTDKHPDISLFIRKSKNEEKEGEVSASLEIESIGTANGPVEMDDIISQIPF